MTITLKEVVLFAIAGIDLALAGFVILHNPKRLVNWIFASVPVGTAFWAVGLIMLSLTPGDIIWGKVVFGASFFIFPLLVIFSDVFPDKNKLEWWHFLILLPGLIFLLVSPVELIFGSRPSGGPQATGDTTSFYSFFNLYILACLAWTTLNLLRKYRRAIAITRLQLYYLFFGFFIFVVFGLIANLFLPLLTEQELVMLGPASSLIFVTFATYSILKYRLMDIRAAVQRGVVLIGMAAAAPPLFFTTYQILVNFLPGARGLLSPTEEQFLLLIAGIISLLVLIFCGTPLIHLFFKFTERFFFRGTYFYPDVVTRLKAVFDQARSIKDLCVNLTEVLVTVFKTDKAVFILKDKVGRTFSPAYMRGADDPSTFTFDSTDELINYAKREKGIFLTEEIKGNTIMEKEVLAKLRGRGIEVCISVETRKGLQGLVCLGGKTSGDPYTTRDVNLFRIVSELSGIALENIWLYTSLVKGAKSDER